MIVQQTPNPDPAVRPRAGDSSGFSLLELLVVVAIIGVLSAFVAPRYFNNVEKSQVQAARQQLGALNVAISAYRLDVGEFPDNALGLQALLRPGTQTDQWRGPYLDGDIPVDPWGTPYGYRHPGQSGRDYDLFSLGADKKVGGTGDATDIVR